MAKIKTITARCCKSKDYNSIDIQMTAEIEENDKPNGVALKLYSDCEKIVDYISNSKSEIKEKKNVCEKCGVEVKGKTLKYSLEKYKKVICYDCQKKK